MIRDLDEILGRDNGMRGQIVGFTLAGILEGVVFALTIPILKAVVRGDYGAAIPWVVSAALVAAACGAVRWIAENRAYRIGIERFAGGIMHRLGEHLVQIPLGWFSKANRGAFTRLVTEGTAILMSIPGMIVAQLVTVTVTPATVAIAVLFVDWRLSFAMVVFVPLGIRAYRNVQRAVVPEYEAIGKSESELASRVVEYAQAQQVLRSAGKSAEGWNRLDEALVSNRDAHLQEIGSVDKYLLRFMIVVQVAFLAVLALAALLVTTGSIDTASVIVVLVLAVRFVEPMQMLAGFGEGISLARVSLGSVREMIDVPVLAEPEVPKEPTSYDIRFDSVSFGYGPDRVIRSVSLEFPESSVTALVGPSGSGKTTLVRLISRFWDVDEGTVSIGGVDVRDIGTRALMSRISTVSQQVYLFDGTIVENVRLARPDATESEVRQAVVDSRLDEVIDRLPSGEETRVGEGGSLLSGGERQRVSIARAFLKDTPIVLLDEATSALDGENEVAITEAIHQLARGRTVVVIAHRLSTIQGADHIVFLEGGTVEEVGSHQDLIAHGGKYSDLWAERSGAEGWRIDRAREP